MDLKARLRSGLLSLEDRDLSIQGHMSVKMLIDKLQTVQQAGMLVRELTSGLDKCGRSAANNRILLLSYLLVTQGQLSPVRALPQAMPSLVAYLQRQHHSTNQDDLSTLGNRLGQALAAALSGDAAQHGGQSVNRWGDVQQLSDRRSSLGMADSAAAGSARDVAAFLPDPPWVLNHVILPLLRVACRGPERDAMAAACAVLVPLADTLGRQATRRGRSAQGPAATVLQRLLGWAFTLLGSAAAPMRSAGVLQLLASCVQALGPSLEVDAAKRAMLAATAGLDCTDDWQVRREAANLIRVLAGLALSPEAPGRRAAAAVVPGGDDESGGGAAAWMAGPHRREFLLQALEPLRHDKFPAVRAAFSAAAAAVALLPATPAEDEPVPPAPGDSQESFGASAEVAAQAAASSLGRSDSFRRATSPPPAPQLNPSAAAAVRLSPRASRSAQPSDGYPFEAADTRGSGSIPWRGDAADWRQSDQRGGGGGHHDSGVHNRADAQRWGHRSLSREASFSGMNVLSAGAGALARHAADVWQGAAAAAAAAEGFPGRAGSRGSAVRGAAWMAAGEDEEGRDQGLPPQPRRGGAGLRPQAASEPAQRSRHASPAAMHSAPDPGSRGAARGRSFGLGVSSHDDEFSEAGMSGGRATLRGSRAGREHSGADEYDDSRGSGAFSFGGSFNTNDGRGAEAGVPDADVDDGRGRAAGWHVPGGGGGSGVASSGRRVHSLSSGRHGQGAEALDSMYFDRQRWELDGWEGEEEEEDQTERQLGMRPRGRSSRPRASAASGSAMRVDDMPALLPSKSPPARSGGSRTSVRLEEAPRHRAPSRGRPGTAVGPSQSRPQPAAPLRQASPPLGPARQQQQQQQPVRPPWRVPSRGPSPRRRRSASPSAGEGQPAAPPPAPAAPRAFSPPRRDLVAPGQPLAWWGDAAASPSPADPGSRAPSPSSRRPESAAPRSAGAPDAGPGGAVREERGAGSRGGGGQSVASSPTRRFQRRDTSRVSLGWPSGYRPPRASPRFRRPAGLPAQEQLDFGVQVFAKDPPPPSPSPPAAPGPGGAEPLYRVEVRAGAGEDLTALVQMQVGAPTSPVAGRQPGPGGVAGARDREYAAFWSVDGDADGGGYPAHRIPDVYHPGFGHAGTTAPVPVPGAAAAALAAGAAAAAAGMSYGDLSQQQQQQQQRLNAMVQLMGGEGRGVRHPAEAWKEAAAHAYGAVPSRQMAGGPGLDVAGGAPWSSEDGEESTSGAGGSNGGGWGGGPRGSAAMEHQLQALVEQAQALQASLVRLGRRDQGGGGGGTRRPRRRWDSSHPPATAWAGDPDAGPGGMRQQPQPPGLMPGVDSLAVSAAVQQLQTLLQQAAAAQASLQLLLAGAGTPAALHGAVHRLEELVDALQQTGTGIGPGAAAFGTSTAPAEVSSGAWDMPPSGALPGDAELGRDPRVRTDGTGGLLGAETTGALQDLIRQVEATRQSISRIAIGEASPRQGGGLGPDRAPSPPRVPPSQLPSTSGRLSPGRSLAQSGGHQQAMPRDHSNAATAHVDRPEAGPSLSPPMWPPYASVPAPPSVRPPSPWETALPEALRATAASTRPGRSGPSAATGDGRGAQLSGMAPHPTWGATSLADITRPSGASTSPRVRFSVPEDEQQSEASLAQRGVTGYGETEPEPEQGSAGLGAVAPSVHRGEVPRVGSPTSKALDRAGRGITAALSSLIQRTESLRVPGAPSAPPPPRPVPTPSAYTSSGVFRPPPSAAGSVAVGSLTDRQRQGPELQLSDRGGPGPGGGGGGRWSEGASLSSLATLADSREVRAGRPLPSAARPARRDSSWPPRETPAVPTHSRPPSFLLGDDESDWQHDGSLGRSHRYSHRSPPRGTLDSQWGVSSDAGAGGLSGLRSGAFPTTSGRTARLSSTAPGSGRSASPSLRSAAGGSSAWDGSPSRAASTEAGPVPPPPTQHVPRIIDFRPLLPVATLRPHVVSPAGSPADVAAGGQGDSSPGHLLPRSSSPTPIQAAMSRLHSLGAALARFDGRQDGRHDGTVASGRGGSGSQHRRPAAAVQPQPAPALPGSPPRQPLYPMAVVPRQPRYPAAADNDAALATGASLDPSFSTVAPAAGSRSASPSVQTILGRELSHLTVTRPPGATPAGLNTTTAAAAQAAARLAALDIADTATSRPARAEIGIQTAAGDPSASSGFAGLAIGRRRDSRSPHRLAVVSTAAASPPDAAGQYAGLLAFRPAAAGSPVVAQRDDSSPARSAGSVMGTALGRLLAVSGRDSPPVLTLGSARTTSSQDAALLSSLDLAVREPLVLDINTGAEESPDGPAQAATSTLSPQRQLLATARPGSPTQPASPGPGQLNRREASGVSGAATAGISSPAGRGMADGRAHEGQAAAAARSQTSAGDLVAVASVTEVENAAARAAALNRMLSTPVGFPAGGTRPRSDQHGAGEVLIDSDGEELVAYALPTLEMRSSVPPGSGHDDLAAMFPATAAALALQRETDRQAAQAATTLQSQRPAADDIQRASYAGFGAMPTPRAKEVVQDATDVGDGRNVAAWPPLMQSPDPAFDVRRRQVPRVLRPENLQALRDSATGLARSSIEAVREVEELVVRLTLLQQHLARRRTADARPQESIDAGTESGDGGEDEVQDHEVFELPLLYPGMQ